MARIARIRVHGAPIFALVREDGTIPQFEPPHWTLLNTFRTQAQISGADGGVCDLEG